MPIPVSIKTTRLISVHDQEPIRLQLPNITPGTYVIPGISSPESEFAKCVFSFRGKPPVQYAQLRELSGKKYVEIEVFEGKTPQYGNEFVKGLTDDYGHLMEPPLVRALLTVTAQEIANELERQSAFFDQNIGVLATDEEVSDKLLAKAIENNINFMKRNVAETNRWSKFGQINITEQAKSHAAKLHKMGLLNPLPPWATINPDGEAMLDTMNCLNCGSVLRKSIIKCPTPGCGVIYDWKAAVDHGIIAPRDVPRSKRLAAGLDVTPTKEEKLAEIRERLAEPRESKSKARIDDFSAENV